MSNANGAFASQEVDAIRTHIAQSLYTIYIFKIGMFQFGLRLALTSHKSRYHGNTL